MKNNFLNGLIAAPFTPMNHNGTLELKTIRLYAKKLAGIGITGAFVCGTTGEVASLTSEEKMAVLEEWVRTAPDDFKIIAHVGSTCQQESINLAAHAAQNKVNAISSFAPHYYKPDSAETLLSYFKPIAEAAPDLPFYYYHIPSFTGVHIPVSSILKQAREIIPNFAGVKFTHFDLLDMQQSIAFNNGAYELFNGFDEILICGLSLGLKSAIGSTFNFMPSVYLDLMEAFKTNDLEKARSLQQYAVRVIGLFQKHGGVLRTGKAIMEMTGIDCGPCRLPVNIMTDDEKNKLKKKLDEIGFFEYTRQY